MTTKEALHTILSTCSTLLDAVLVVDAQAMHAEGRLLHEEQARMRQVAWDGWKAAEALAAELDEVHCQAQLEAHRERLLNAPNPYEVVTLPPLAA